jgi:TolB-like protein
MARILARLELRQVLGRALAIGFFVCVPLAPSAAQPAGVAPPTVAVLPLKNASGDADQDFFADGITDEIAVALTRVPGLDVVARSSIFRFKEQNHDIAAIGKAVKARYLLDGSARKVDSRVRISAKLIRADSNAQLWSEDYDTDFANIFDVQGDIAQKIAAALRVPTGLKPGEKLVRDRAKDLDAYQDFLRAKVLARARGAKPLADAAVVLEKVLAREPDYAPAAALLAYDYALTPLFERSLRTGMPDEERKVVARTIPRAEALAKHATTLDPKAAEGFVSLGYANLVQMKMLAAEDAFKKAIVLDPNQADGMHGYSQFLAAMGRIKESIAMREHLQDVEQFIINYTADTAEIYWLDGETDRAIAILQPFAPGRTLELALIQAATGRYREAAVAVRQIQPTNYLPGMTEAAARMLDSASRAVLPDSLPKLGNLGFVYMHVGAPERVMEFYEDEVRAGYFQPISTTWFWHPSYDAVRKTARFKAFARDAGLVEYWRARGWPAACHPVGADDFTCS